MIIRPRNMEHPPVHTTPKRFWTTAVYCIMVLLTIGLFLLIRRYGELLMAPPPLEPLLLSHANTTPQVDVFRHILLVLIVVMVTGWIISKLFLFLQQPPVIGEVVAGILLGPSFLGHLAPEVSTYLLPPAVAPFLGVIAQLGVILYMFIVGLELNVGLLRERAHATIAISHASIIAPFLLGSLLAISLYPRLSSSDVQFTNFALFLGVAMSVTAFPVLARILTDQQMSKTDIGVIALTCAATDDVTAWCLLAFVVGVTQAQVGSALWVTPLALGYIAFMFFAVRPIAERVAARCAGATLGGEAVALALVGVVLSALADG